MLRESGQSKDRLLFVICKSRDEVSWHYFEGTKDKSKMMGRDLKSDLENDAS